MRHLDCRVMMKQARCLRGFTLLELLVALLIVALVTAWGIPNFRETVRNNRLSSYTNDLLATLNLARSEATRRNVSVTVRRVDNLSSTNLGTGANWENGWDVFTDANGDGQFTAGADQLIKTFRRT